VKILLCLFPILLVGCTSQVSIPVEAIEKGKEKCSISGGMAEIVYKETACVAYNNRLCRVYSNTYQAVCSDGTRVLFLVRQEIL